MLCSNNLVKPWLLLWAPLQNLLIEQRQQTINSNSCQVNSNKEISQSLNSWLKCNPPKQLQFVNQPPLHAVPAKLVGAVGFRVGARCCRPRACSRQTFDKGWDLVWSDVSGGCFRQFFIRLLKIPYGNIQYHMIDAWFSRLTMDPYDFQGKCQQWTFDGNTSHGFQCGSL